MAGDFNTRLVPIRDTLHAPIIFFEFGTRVRIWRRNRQHNARCLLPSDWAPPRLRGEAAITAYLKCSVQAAVNLRDAINNALSRVPPPPTVTDLATTKVRKN